MTAQAMYVKWKEEPIMDCETRKRKHEKEKKGGGYQRKDETEISQHAEG